MLKIKINGKYDFHAEKNLLNGKEIHPDIILIKDKHFNVILDNKSYSAEVVHADYSAKTFIIKVNGNNYSIEAKDKFDELLKQLGMDNLSSVKVNEIKAPMPGLVLKVLVQEGTVIKKGDSVLILEAMKMENVLKSPGDGKIKSLKAKPGDKVEKNQLLVVME